jgi:hypothetical protein
MNVLIALDQLLNVLLGGWADETLSSRAYRMDGLKRRWTLARRAIDALFFWQPQHCWQAYHAERARRQMPPALRRDQ